MSAPKLYHTWFREIRKLWPTERVTRLRNLTWMLVGMYLSRSVHLQEMAAKLPLEVRLTSIARRFRRFLNNLAFDPRAWYASCAQSLLAQAAATGSIRLILDASKVGAGHRLLMVALAYRKRALPIAWTWVQGAQGLSSVQQQLSLLRYVHTLVPAQANVQVLGDGEFGRVPVAHQLNCWGWRYVLRLKGDLQVCISHTTLRWQSLADLVTQRDHIVWHPGSLVTIRHLFRAHVLCYWATGEPDPWLLMTNLPDPRQGLQAYRRRMWIEEMFGDWKGHGVDLETTHLRQADRLSRLVFVVALLYLWLVSRGSQTIKAGLRAWVDRRGRRDLSVFRIGLYVMDRLCALGRSFRMRLIPYF